jgi:predicted protein tyrosine phosphatase
MNIRVFSQRMAEDPDYFLEEVPTGAYSWISIISPTCYSRPVENERCRGIHRLKFHDIDRPVSGQALFSAGQARRLVDFVLAHRDVDTICVHCEAGISRSGGVAKALALWLNGNDWTQDDGNLYPNIHVKSTILRTLRERGLV